MRPPALSPQWRELTRRRTLPPTPGRRRVLAQRRCAPGEWTSQRAAATLAAASAPLSKCPTGREWTPMTWTPLTAEEHDALVNIAAAMADEIAELPDDSIWRET